MTVTASASAKTILFGEHAVVYGEPAIAIPLHNIRTYVSLIPNGKKFRIISEKIGLDTDFDGLKAESGLSTLFVLLMEELGLDRLPEETLEIRSEIPIASGLGSGAALSAAVIRAFGKRFKRDFSPKEVNRITFEIEKIYHGTPSGIDNTVISYEEPIIYTKGTGFSPLDADLTSLPLLVADSGIRSRTVDVVSDVRAHFNRNEGPIREIGLLVQNACDALRAADLPEIGRLMNENQRLLRAIDVSCPELDVLIDAALSQGALGAKLTGAGRGGNLIVLAQNKAHAERIKTMYKEQRIAAI